jgi:hypothetical protein
MKMMIDIPEEVNRELHIYKHRNNLGTKQKATLKILSDYFKIKEAENEVSKSI